MSEPESRKAFEKIVPRAPSPAAASPSSSDRSAAPDSAGISGRTLLISLALILMLGLLLIIVLPGLLKSDEGATTTAASAPVIVTENAKNNDAMSEALPIKPVWDDPDLLRARAASQDLKSQYQSNLKTLEMKGVEHWGAQALDQAKLQAQVADKSFQAQDFSISRTSFESAVQQIQALLDEVDVRLTAALEEAQAALGSGNKAAAEEAFSLALKIDPDNQTAQRGMQRVATLDQVLAKLETGRRLEQADDQSGALRSYREALALDADTLEAQQAIGRIESLRRDQEFQQAMGLALTALDQGSLDLAATHLARARSLRADDAGLHQASARLNTARNEIRLSSLMAESQAQAEAENWSGAVASYEAALKIDPSTGFARDGLQNAKQRAALSAALQDLINRPTRLQSAAVRAEAQRTVGQAESIASAGPVLQEQIATLKRAIAAATQPVDVQLTSDDQTEVTIYRVGNQGRFLNRSISLTPGKYVAVGVRPGFRDVRRNIEVQAQMAPVDIRCSEPI